MEIISSKQVLYTQNHNIHANKFSQKYTIYNVTAQDNHTPTIVTYYFAFYLHQMILLWPTTKCTLFEQVKHFYYPIITHTLGYIRRGMCLNSVMFTLTHLHYKLNTRIKNSENLASLHNIIVMDTIMYQYGCKSHMYIYWYLTDFKKKQGSQMYCIIFARLRHLFDILHLFKNRIK